MYMMKDFNYTRIMAMKMLNSTLQNHLMWTTKLSGQTLPAMLETIWIIFSHHKLEKEKQEKTNCKIHDTHWWRGFKSVSVIMLMLKI